MTLKPEERETLIRHSKEKSREAIENVSLLIGNEKFSLAVNQIYYGMYYMLSALALKHHFSTSKHLQLIGWFNKTFAKGELIDKKYAKWVRKAYDNRIDGDYNVLSHFTQEEVEHSFEEMKEAIAVLEKLIDA
jgi:uncharacterized protein (UPF0332 family)